MKRLRRSDSMAGLIPICPTTSEEYSPRRTSDMYGFQSMLGNYDEDSSINVVEYSGGGGSEKKRRLGVEQVKALEKNFELENKLEPERKVKLAQELGLQPRQVAVWFQNRRARWKTKQLERDYGSLKAEYDALRVNHDALRRDNHALLRQINQLKSKLNGEDDNNNINGESDISVKEEDVEEDEEEEDGEEIGEMQCETLEQLEPSSSSQPDLLEVPTGFKYDSFNCGTSIFPNSDSFKDGSSDSSDSSTVLNEGNSPIPAAASSTGTAEITAEIPAGFFRFVKMETGEPEDLFGGDAACGFFSDEQPPSLSWYSSADQWN